MPFSLLYNTPHALLMPLYDEPKLVGDNYELTTAMWDNIEDIKDLFDDLQVKLNNTTGPDIWDLAAKLTYLHPLIIHFDDPETTRKYYLTGPTDLVTVHNSFGLPKECLKVDDTMKELTHTDMLGLIMNRFKRQAIRRGI